MKLTTNSLKYPAEIKRLLTFWFGAEWTPVWCYCQMTSLIEGQSFTFLIKSTLAESRFLYRKWALDEHRGNNYFGILNFDKIKVAERELQISLNELFEIQKPFTFRYLNYMLVEQFWMESI